MNYAFMWAIDTYQYVPARLQGCVNDILAAKSVTKFTTTTKTNSTATKANILAGMNSLVTKAKSGDHLLFVESGHGTKVADVNGDELEGFDECFVPYDAIDYRGRVNFSNLIKDDEIAAILAQVKYGVSVDFVCDSCYSGSATRGLDFLKWTPRVIPGPLAKGRKAKRAISVIDGINHCAWEACTDMQTAAEGTVNGVHRGLFSYMFWNAINEFRSTKTRAEIYEIVKANVVAMRSNQTPVLECSQSESLELPFV